MNKKILIVDDDANILDLLENRLEAAGFDVVACEEVGAAYERLQETSPDLIILDFLMPGILGTSLINGSTVRKSMKMCLF